MMYWIVVVLAYSRYSWKLVPSLHSNTIQSFVVRVLSFHEKVPVKLASAPVPVVVEGT